MPLSQPVQTISAPTGVASELRTQFCTTTGWHRYDAITSAMRGVILSASSGAGLVKCPPSKRTEDALIAMGLIERRGNLFALTYHGELAWLELDAP